MIPNFFTIEKLILLAIVFQLELVLSVSVVAPLINVKNNEVSNDTTSSNHLNKSQPETKVLKTVYSAILKHENVGPVTERVVTKHPAGKGTVIAEGGVEMINKNISLKISSIENNLTNVRPQVSSNQTYDKSKSKAPTKPTPVTVSKPIHKRIHGRPGVSDLDAPKISSAINNITLSTTVPTTESKPVPKKKKPLFTMIPDDTKQSESFIESPITGKDYVLPIVLIILSIPVAFYLIKVIYKRGTEFTERQQYHRMYLIDGMYNSR